MEDSVCLSVSKNYLSTVSGVDPWNSLLDMLYIEESLAHFFIAPKRILKIKIRSLGDCRRMILISSIRGSVKGTAT